MNHFLTNTIKWGAFALLTILPLTTYSATSKTALVSGFARSFITGNSIDDATITVLETGQVLKTDSQGRFGPFPYPVGKPITLEFDKWDYQKTQSETVIVPPTGLNDAYTNITFQVPSVEAYFLLATVIGEKADAESCHVATTITAHHKTMDDLPQGEENAQITLSPSVPVLSFYFDIFKKGPLAGKTNPFTKELKQTSEDGGVLLINVPPSEKPYVLSATKKGVTFSKVMFTCRKGAFINLSPPNGPMAKQ